MTLRPWIKGDELSLNLRGELLRILRRRFPRVDMRIRIVERHFVIFFFSLFGFHFIGEENDDSNFAIVEVSINKKIAKLENFNFWEILLHFDVVLSFQEINLN